MKQEFIHALLNSEKEVGMIKKRGLGYYMATAIIFIIAVFTLGLEGYLMAPRWGWKAMSVWIPFTSLAFWGSYIVLSYLIDATNRWIIPHIIRLLEK